MSINSSMRSIEFEIGLIDQKYRIEYGKSASDTTSKHIAATKKYYRKFAEEIAKNKESMRLTTRFKLSRDLAELAKSIEKSKASDEEKIVLIYGNMSKLATKYKIEIEMPSAKRQSKPEKKANKPIEKTDKPAELTGTMAEKVDKPAEKTNAPADQNEPITPEEPKQPDVQNNEDTWQDDFNKKYKRIKDKVDPKKREEAEYIESLKERISKSMEAAKKKRAEQGIVASEPCQTLDLADVRKLAQQQKAANQKRKSIAQRVAESDSDIKKKLNDFVKSVQMENQGDAHGDEAMSEEELRIALEDIKRDIDEEGKRIQAERAKAVELNRKNAEAEALRRKAAEEAARKEAERIKIAEEEAKKTKAAEKAAKKEESKKKVGGWIKKIPLFGTAVAAAVAAVVGVGTFIHNQFSNNQKDFQMGNSSHSDQMLPGNESETKAETTSYASIVQATTKTSRATTQTKAPSSTTQTTTVQTTTQTTTTAHSTETPESTTATSTDNKVNIETEPVVINIGDKIYVPEGIEYAGSCYGEFNRNAIGNSECRPAKDYYVDRVAIMHGSQILGMMNRGDENIRENVESYAEQYNINVSDIETKVLLSVVQGKGDTGWANISIDEIEGFASGTTQSRNDNGAAEFDLER